VASVSLNDEDEDYRGGGGGGGGDAVAVGGSNMVGVVVAEPILDSPDRSNRRLTAKERREAFEVSMCVYMCVCFF
jgi:hypothetical protein